MQHEKRSAGEISIYCQAELTGFFDHETVVDLLECNVTSRRSEKGMNKMREPCKSTRILTANLPRQDWRLR